MPQHLQDLKQRILEAVQSMNRETLQSMWTELEYRLDVCKVNNGTNFEHS